MNEDEELRLDIITIDFSGTDPIACDSFSDVRSDPIASLNTTLKKFAGPRNHMTSSDAKEKARDLIKKSFQDFGLHVWSEKVVLNKVGAFKTFYMQ